MKTLLLGASLFALASIGRAQEIDSTSIKFTIPNGVALGDAGPEGEVYLLTWNGTNGKTFLMFSHAPPDAQEEKHDDLVATWKKRFETQFESRLPEGFSVESVKSIERKYSDWKGHEILSTLKTGSGGSIFHSFFILRDARNVWFAQFRGDEKSYQAALKVLHDAKPKSEQVGGGKGE